jgi:glycosyltransferase involved in cell wall biosynthesis
MDRQPIPHGIIEPVAAPTLSVIVPNYNHGEFLPEAVASVTGMGRHDVELIVVDDGSTDSRTSEEVNKIETHGVKVIRQQNKGLAAARNAAIAASHGEYIFPLDADDRMRPGWIDRAIQILDSNPKVGVVYGDAQCFGTRGDLWRVGAFDRDRLLSDNFIHASALYRRSLWEQNAGYDGAMPVQGFEDWDFWIGALGHDWRFVYIPEVFFEYRQGPQSMIVRASNFKHAVEEFLVKKHSRLYRQAWVRLARERQSAKRTGRRLGKLLKARLRQKLSKNPGDLWVNE